MRKTARFVLLAEGLVRYSKKINSRAGTNLVNLFLAWEKVRNFLMLEALAEQLDLSEKSHLVGHNGGETTPSTSLLNLVGHSFTRHGQLSLVGAEAPYSSGVVSVSELPGDTEIIRQARRNLLSAEAASIALDATVETKVKPIRNIYEAILWASEEDEEGQDMLKANIAKDASERLFKAGNVTNVKLGVDPQGKIIQNGQRIDDVHRNAYKFASNHPVIKERTIAEANNGARIESAYHIGDLDDKVFVVFSMCAEGLSDDELDELSFFSKTKTLSIQGTTVGPDGVLHTESAYIAGVKDEKSQRHDRKIIEKIGKLLGIDFEGKSASEIIDMPVLIPKELIPNGVVDLVKVYDYLNGGTFFGQDMPQQDYKAFKEFCLLREAGFDDDVKKIASQLIYEASKLSGPVEASQRLGKLVEAHFVDRALVDETIDPSVFGTVSAKNIFMARASKAEGDYERANAYMQVARATATSGSCPAAFQKNVQLQDNSKFEGSDEAWSGGSTHTGKCEGCKKVTKVGVKSWCKDCISGHCGTS